METLILSISALTSGYGLMICARQWRYRTVCSTRLRCAFTR